MTYGYDLNSRLTRTSDNSASIASVVPPGGATSVSYTTAYTYDATNRLTGTSWNPAPAAATPTAMDILFDDHPKPPSPLPSPTPTTRPTSCRRGARRPCR